MDSTAQSHVFCLSYAYMFPERRRRRRRLYRHMTHFGRNPTRGDCGNWQSWASSLKTQRWGVPPWGGGGEGGGGGKRRRMSDVLNFNSGRGVILLQVAACTLL